MMTHLLIPIKEIEEKIAHYKDALARFDEAFGGVN